MGQVIAAIVKELSCHEMARYVCNDASVHSRYCDTEECCECDVETRSVKPQETEADFEVEVDSPGCMDIEGLCCFMHASGK